MDLVAAIIAFIVGFGTGWTAKVIISNRSTKTYQRGNSVGGDMAGGDIHKK